MLSLHNKTVENLNDFSSDFQLIIQMIQGGNAWIKRSIEDARELIPILSEQVFLRQIQWGLHETSLLNIGDYRLDIAKLFELDSEELGSLLNYAKGKAHDSKALEQLTERHNLVSFTALEDVQAFLDEQQLADHAIFKSIAFSDQLSLYEFHQLIHQEPTSLLKEAVAFAMQHSATVSQFCNFVEFYMNTVKHQMDTDVSTEQRPQNVQKVFSILEPLTFYLTTAPTTEALEDPHYLLQQLTAIKSVFQTFYGYGTKAAAMNNLVQNISITNRELNDIQGDIETYLFAVRDAIAAAELTSPTVSQDGLTHDFHIDSEDFNITLSITSKGTILPSPRITRKKKQ